MKSPLVTAGDAPVPAAVPAFQRRWTPRIAYRLSEQLQDRRHGRRDRARLAGRRAPEPGEHPEPGTPWLHVLSQTCAGHLATEHRDARALIAVLDHELAEAAAETDRIVAELGSASARVDVLLVEVPTVDPRQVEADGDWVARARAERALAAQVSVAAARVEALEGRLAAIEVRVATLLEDRTAHWEILQRRAAVILAHFDTRAATYADAAGRGRAEVSYTPSVSRPAWVAGPVPPAPTAVSPDIPNIDTRR